MATVDIPKTMLCPECKKQIEPEANVCPHCESELDGVKKLPDPDYEQAVREAEAAEGNKADMERKLKGKAPLVARIIAAIIDGIIGAIFGAIGGAIVGILGPILQCGYILAKDGLMKGQSAGKKAMGLRVINVTTNQPIEFPESIKRNISISIGSMIGVLIALISMVAGKLIAGIISMVALIPALIAFVIILIELYFVYSDTNGQRWGDQFAETKVIEA